MLLLKTLTDNNLTNWFDVNRFRKTHLPSYNSVYDLITDNKKKNSALLRWSVFSLFFFGLFVFFSVLLVYSFISFWNFDTAFSNLVWSVTLSLKKISWINFGFAKRCHKIVTLKNIWKNIVNIISLLAHCPKNKFSKCKSCIVEIVFC